MRTVSDRLCREYGLSVIEHPQPGKSRHYGEWRAEQEGKPTYHSIVREDVDEAILQTRTEKQFFHFLKEKGYSIKFGKDITIRPEGRERGLKLKRNFGEEYSLESIGGYWRKIRLPSRRKHDCRRKNGMWRMCGGTCRRERSEDCGGCICTPAEEPPACISETTSFPSA